MTYTYGMRLRPASIGAIPAKGIMEIINDRKQCDEWGRKKGRCYHSLLSYCRELTPKEMDEYELDFLEVDE